MQQLLADDARCPFDGCCYNCSDQCYGTYGPDPRNPFFGWTPYGVCTFDVLGTLYRDDIMQSDDGVNTSLGFYPDDHMTDSGSSRITILSVDGPDISSDVVCAPGQGDRNASGALPELYVTLTQLDELSDLASAAGTVAQLGMALSALWPVVLAIGC